MTKCYYTHIRTPSGIQPQLYRAVLYTQREHPLSVPTEEELKQLVNMRKRLALQDRDHTTGGKQCGN